MSDSWRIWRAVSTLRADSAGLLFYCSCSNRILHSDNQLKARWCYCTASTWHILCIITESDKLSHTTGLLLAGVCRTGKPLFLLHQGLQESVPCSHVSWTSSCMCYILTPLRSKTSHPSRCSGLKWPFAKLCLQSQEQEREKDKWRREGFLLMGGVVCVCVAVKMHVCTNMLEGLHCVC